MAIDARAAGCYPLNNDANLQATPVWSSYGSSFVNAGADMRTIPTDDIESVEIVRGIPSVEYGDLTSGMVKIKRRQGGRDLRVPQQQFRLHPRDIQGLRRERG